MMTTFNIWLQENSRIKGILAAGIRYPDKSTTQNIYQEGFDPAALENAWHIAADAFQLLKQQKTSSNRLRWVFEKCILICISRSDGNTLCVFVSKAPNAPPTDELERMFSDFQKMWA